MTIIRTAIPVPGTPAYWQAMREGFALLRALRRAIDAAKHAPTYIAGAWDEEYGSYEPVENLAPHERVDDLTRDAMMHPYVAGILRAWGVEPEELARLSYDERLRRLPPV